MHARAERDGCIAFLFAVYGLDGDGGCTHVIPRGGTAAAAAAH